MMKLAEIQAACGVLCVDLAAVVDNYQTLARHVAPAQCGAVLKANGYGLGAEAIAPALYAANCRIFFVAQLSEGVALRNILSADAMVVLLNGVMPQAMPFCCAQQITPLLNSVDQVMTWLALQEARSQRRPVLIQLDSGMSRLGVTPEQLARLAAIFRQRGWAAPDYIISHLANADRPDHALNVYQHTLLQQAKKGIPNQPLFAGKFLRYVSASGLAGRSLPSGRCAVRRRPAVVFNAVKTGIYADVDHFARARRAGWDADWLRQYGYYHSPAAYRHGIRRIR